ncbi:hypothetical protein AT746_13335 [Lacimicrobium alkaliphilum]|uniref:Uncharacterized protein n=1 Tax=Lacimicrobium alkaliphilum TaxID=1526571 RepID=A0A0U2QNI1_9ALTE|nr:hypothetical protein AT746_13335 [Lacimicrobium alkaliphilum]
MLRDPDFYQDDGVISMFSPKSTVYFDSIHISASLRLCEIKNKKPDDLAKAQGHRGFKCLKRIRAT